MKNEQRRMAQDLFLQSGLNKTQIADKLNVSRRTIYQWSLEGDWDKLRQSARCMPSILAEKVYYLIGHFTDHLLQRESCYQSVSKDEVNILHKLTVTVNKLKQGSTINENMETFTHFLERVQRADPELAQQVVPHVSGYIESRRNIRESDLFLRGFTESGQLPFPEEEIMERWQDEEDATALEAEALTAQAGAAPAQPAATAPSLAAAANSSAKPHNAPATPANGQHGANEATGHSRPSQQGYIAPWQHGAATASGTPPGSRAA